MDLKFIISVIDSRKVHKKMWKMSIWRGWDLDSVQDAKNWMDSVSSCKSWFSELGLLSCVFSILLK